MTHFAASPIECDVFTACGKLKVVIFPIRNNFAADNSCDTKITNYHDFDIISFLQYRRLRNFQLETSELYFLLRFEQMYFLYVILTTKQNTIPTTEHITTTK
jgi:hypothetical protein